MRDDYLKLTVDIVAQYAGGNQIDPDALLELIPKIYAQLVQVASAQIPLSTKVEDDLSQMQVQLPSLDVPLTVEESLSSPEYMISFIDRKPYKMLKKHLSSYGISPMEYRRRYNLPSDYPMIAPNIVKRRLEREAAQPKDPKPAVVKKASRFSR